VSSKDEGFVPGLHEYPESLGFQEQQ